MLQHQRVVSAIMESQAISLVDDPLIEIQIPADVQATLMGIEIGPAEGTDPVAEIQEVMIYSATGVGTGGSAITEALIRGSGTIKGVALRNLTAPGAGLLEFHASAFHVKQGWLYAPIPDLMYESLTGAQDNFGFYFPTAPDQATTFSATLYWGETG